jgi:hypothetical protein
MRARVWMAAAVAAGAISVVAVAWSQDVSDLSADDAITATRRALEGAGLDAEVDPAPLRTTYRSQSRGAVEVWSVRATVRSAPIELRLAIAGAQPVSIDDRTVDGSSYVLSEPEYQALATRVDDPGRARAIRRNMSITLAAVLVAALATIHAAVAAQPEEAPR